MSIQTWQETLVNQIAAGTLFNTYTTAKSVINAQALYTFPAGYFVIGKTIRITAQGGISVKAGGTLTMTLLHNMGATGTIGVFYSGLVATGTLGITTLPFQSITTLTCRAVGSGTSANFMGICQLIGSMINVGTPGAIVPITAPAVGAGFDSTIANILDFWVGFSSSDAGNGVQIQNYFVESLN